MMARRPMGASRHVLGGFVAVVAIGGGLLLTASGPALAAQDPHPATVTGEAPVAVTAARVAANRAERQSRIARREAEAAVEEADRADRATAMADGEAEEAGRRAAAVADRADAMTSGRDRHVAFAWREAERQGREAAKIDVDAEAISRVALANARSGLARQCAAAGRPVSAAADWETLATCGHIHETVRISLQRVHDILAASHGLSHAAMAHAVTGPDRAGEVDRADDTAPVS